MTKLESLAREVIACESCPRLREYCEHVAEVKKRAFRDQGILGTSGSFVRRSQGRAG